MTICEHIKDNGSTCGSPALTGYSFCFFHQRLRHPRHRPGDFEYKLPILDTPESILMAIQHITQAALDGVLEDKRARLVLSALRLAQSTLKQIKKEKEEDDSLDAARPRAASTSTADVRSAPATAELDNVDTGACPERSRRVQARVGVAPATPSSPKKPPLSAHQSKLLKKILRRGPSHPQFKLAARLLDHHIADRSTA